MSPRAARSEECLRLESKEVQLRELNLFSVLPQTLPTVEGIGPERASVIMVDDGEFSPPVPIAPPFATRDGGAGGCARSAGGERADAETGRGGAAAQEADGAMGEARAEGGGGAEAAGSGNKKKKRAKQRGNGARQRARGDLGEARYGRREEGTPG